MTARQVVKFQVREHHYIVAEPYIDSEKVIAREMGYEATASPCNGDCLGESRQRA
jgi:hypothetical protein